MHKNYKTYAVCRDSGALCISTIPWPALVLLIWPMPSRSPSKASSGCPQPRSGQRSGCYRTDAAVVQPQGVVEAAAVTVGPSAAELPAASPAALLTSEATSVLHAAGPRSV